MDYLILCCIGIVMGLFGGLLGIGGSIVMIPALLIFFKQSPEDQHLFQAAAMICNFFVGLSAFLVHKKEKALVTDVIKWLVPAGVVAILAGVWLSNIPFFSGEGAENLTKLFGFFMIYVAVINILRLGKHFGGRSGMDLDGVKKCSVRSFLIGLVTGVSSGLFGLGGGGVCTPLQQIFLKMPLKRAISNSTALIISTALIGAVYKNATLSQHNIAFSDSVRIAAVIIPTAFIFSYIGGRLMHKLPKDIVRIVFILLNLAAAFRLLTS